MNGVIHSIQPLNQFNALKLNWWRIEMNWTRRERRPTKSIHFNSIRRLKWNWMIEWQCWRKSEFNQSIHFFPWNVMELMNRELFTLHWLIQLLFHSFSLNETKWNALKSNQLYYNSTVIRAGIYLLSAIKVWTANNDNVMNECYVKRVMKIDWMNVNEMNSIEWCLKRTDNTEWL